MQIGITIHAADQYLMRVLDECPTEEATREAKAYLEFAVSFAVKLDRRTKTGQEIWQIEDALLVVKQEQSGRRVAVTTLSLDQNNRRPSLALLNAEMVAALGDETQPLVPAEPVKLSRADRLEEMIGPPPVLPMKSVEEANEYLRTAKAKQGQRLTPKAAAALAGRIETVKQWRDAQDGHPPVAQLVGLELALPCAREVAQDWLTRALERLARLYVLQPRTDKVVKATQKLEGRVAQVRSFQREQEPREERT